MQGTRVKSRVGVKTSGRGFHFDVIIIGAGIGGLVAGNYLAKAGLKILIVEQKDKIGGYCGSFNKDGFTFDEAVHYINNLGPGGMLRRICQELGVDKKIKIVAIDPSDRLFMPGFQIAIYRDTERTIQELQELFPSEAQQIQAFFRLITNFDFSSLYVKYKNCVFQDLLSEFFIEDRLKTALGTFAATLGLPAHRLSALAALGYYKGSVLDGGYHPVGGAQAFSDALGEQYQQFGGELMLSRTVKRILVERRRAAGIELEDGTRLVSTFVIANCDATQTFLRLLGDTVISGKDLKKLIELKPSTSTFIVYLGIEGSLKEKVPSCCNLWYLPYERISEDTFDITSDQNPNGFVHIALSSLHDKTITPSGCESLILFVGAPFKDQAYWAENKARLTDILIQRAGHIIPGLANSIRIKLPATPYTLFRYTLNRDGAYRGWDPTPEQAKWGLVSQKTEIASLYLVGHWVTTPVGNGGVSMVAQSGRNVAKAVLRAISEKSSMRSIE